MINKIMSSMWFLLLLQIVDFLLLIAVAFQNYKSALLLVVFFICLMGAGDVCLYTTVKHNTGLDKLNRELAEAQEKNLLKEKYRTSMEAWKRDSADMQHFISEELSKAASLTDPLEINRAINDVRSQISRTREVHYCDHTLTDIILTEKMQEAANSGIDTSAAVCIPGEMGLTEQEWCSIWCNLLDNAIEACGRCPDIHRKISIKAAVRQGYLYIKVENTMNNILQNYETQKSDTQNHGLGLLILKDLAQKHGGELITLPEDRKHTTIFTVLEASDS